MDHTYDALGQRIARVVVGVETDHYGLDNGNVWVVMDGSNTWAAAGCSGLPWTWSWRGYGQRARWPDT